MEPSTQTSNNYDDPIVAQQAQNLTKAIFQHESGTNYNAVGDAGTSHGAGQWQSGTWAAQAKDVLGDANAPMSQANQSIVAQGTIRKLIKQGKNAAQIAAIWNSGNDQDWENKVGTTTINGQKIGYNVPKYVKSVTDLYQQFKGQSSPAGGTVQGQNQPQTGQNPTFLGDLEKTGQNTLQGASTALNQGLSGQINPLSSALQVGGSIAGGIGGAFNNVLEHTPVLGTAYKGLEGLIGQGVGALANTDTGKGVISNYQQFSSDHPELAGDINAGVNIASMVPGIGKGLSVLKGGLTDAVETAVKGSATKAAEAELTSSLTAKAAKGLVKTQARGVDPIKAIISNKEYLPEVVRSGDKFVYDTTKATHAINTSLDGEESQLQEMLKQGVKKNIGVDLDQVRAKVLKDVAKEYSMSGNYKPAVKAVNDYFDSFGESTGGRKIIDLNELNGMKRDVRSSVFGVEGDVRGTAAADIKYNIGQSLMQQVEEVGKKAGVKGISELNKSMASKIEALKILDKITGKAVKSGGGAGREIAKDIAGGAGEMAGNSMGIPLAGTFAGRGLAGLVGRRLPKTALTKLAGSRPLTSTIKTAGKRVGAGLAGQAAVRQPQTQ